MRGNRPLFLPLAIMVVCTIIASLLFVGAFIAWLAELFGSLKLPCLIVGAFMAIIAATVYSVTLKSYFSQIENELSVVYTVARTVRSWINLAATVIGVKESEDAEN
ncbi:MAG: hypothetical protein II262_07545 [Alistipes sp.]|nr:hypothetical protein [Alistipes sp.]